MATAMTVRWLFGAAVVGVAMAGTCDVFAAGGTPCVAAHSTVRALYSSYRGPLYQVRRSSDNASFDVGLLTGSGYADAAAQDAFCLGTRCVFWRIYDQSPRGNHLGVAPGGGNHHAGDIPADAAGGPVNVGGHRVYGLRMDPPSGYRNDSTHGMATGDAPQTMYAVLNGTHYNDRCCFDYGNAETDNLDDGKSTMEALYFGSANGGMNHGGAGKGPWIMADLEKGLWGADTLPSNESSISHAFVSAMVKADSTSSAAPKGHWAIKGGDAQAGELTVYWDGDRPDGYSPMHKKGAIILGIGGDNSDGAVGTFYEGAITTGYSSAATDGLIQADIVAAGYGK